MRQKLSEHPARPQQGPPDVTAGASDPELWVRVVSAVLAASMWDLDTPAIAARIRTEHPELLPAFLRLAGLPVHWADAPASDDDFIAMLAELVEWEPRSRPMPTLASPAPRQERRVRPLRRTIARYRAEEAIAHAVEQGAA